MQQMRAAESDAAPEPRLRLDRIVRLAIRIADNEGLEALSMRRLAGELNAGVMSLYRHVSGKDELVARMVDVAFGEIEYPEAGPPWWRAKLEFSARQEWAMYRRHLWVLPVVAMTQRPPLGPGVAANVEWGLAAVAGFGLDEDTKMQVYLTVSDYVQGAAFYLLNEVEAERRTGLTSAQWWAANTSAVRELLAAGRFPNLARLTSPDRADGSAGNVDGPVSAKHFEFGLRCVLDGLQAFLTGRAAAPAPDDFRSPHRLFEVTGIPRSTAAVLELLGKRWVPELLYVLGRGEARFNELTRSIPGVSNRVLAERLRMLTGEGLVSRTHRAGSSELIGYTLTKRGEALRPAFDHIHAWASAHRS